MAEKNVRSIRSATISNSFEIDNSMATAFSNSILKEEKRKA